VQQRLVRRVCPNCAEPYTPSEDLKAELEREQASAMTWRWGCSRCFTLATWGGGARGVTDIDDTVPEIIYEGP